MKTLVSLALLAGLLAFVPVSPAKADEKKPDAKADAKK